ncbi:MAG: CBS domain-containing protein [Candidatus Lokiarchaeota archaeon]|nr:CBS domain-containing protein [Candidatus Lokiarchaeota archaeon]
MANTQVSEIKQRLLSNDALVLYSLGALTGIISGIGAGVFKHAVIGLSSLFASIPSVIGIMGWIIVPVIGALVSGFIVERYAPEAEGHGIPNIMMSYVMDKGKMRSRVPVVKAVSSAILIGSGGSCGSEGPIGQIGSGTGSALAQYLKLGTEKTRTLMICGMASGIAAIFNAPLGGAIFGLEIIAGEIMGISIIPVILSTVLAVAVSNVIFGAGAAPFVAPQFTLTSEIELIFYLIMGLVFGVLAKGWTTLFYKFEDFFEDLDVTKYVKPALGALFLGVLGIIAIWYEMNSGYQGVFHEEPYTPAIMGTGYAFVNAALLRRVTWISLLIFGIMKMLATSFSVGSGGSGGVFAPTLFIGAGLGGALGEFFAFIAPGAVGAPMAFVLVGMAALFAGAAHAPITCIIMIVEMSGDYGMMLPLMIAVSSSYLVSHSIMNDSIYTLKLSRQNIRLQTAVYVDALKAVMVGMMMDPNPEALSADMPIEVALGEMTRSRAEVLPVVDDDWQLLGLAFADDMQEAYYKWGGELQVRFFIEKEFIRLTPDITMDWVLQNMILHGHGFAIVTHPDDLETMIGTVSREDVLRSYHIVMTTLKEHGEVVEDNIPKLPL